MIEEFVSKVISTFYATCVDVQNDPELKEWMSNIYTSFSISSKSELGDVHHDRLYGILSACGN